MSELSVSESGHDPAEGKTANLVYILYLAALVVGITSLVGLIMAYVNRSDAPEWVQSHCRYQIRTFWIGILYTVIGVAAIFIVIGILILVLVFIWWIVRCAKGIKAINKGQPMENAGTWLW